MPNGKPAGVPCVNLTENLQCGIFHSPDRPAVCGGFQAEKLICGDNRTEAMNTLADLQGIEVSEQLTMNNNQ